MENAEDFSPQDAKNREVGEIPRTLIPLFHVFLGVPSSLAVKNSFPICKFRAEPARCPPVEA
jgi:hypothetical protein